MLQELSEQTKSIPKYHKENMRKISRIENKNHEAMKYSWVTTSSHIPPQGAPLEAKNGQKESSL
jgi:hypothetical protein